MLRQLLRFVSAVNSNTFPKNSLEYQINVASNNSRLLKFYKPNELSIPQLSLMLQKLNLNTNQLSEINALFNTSEGINFLKEISSKHTLISVKDKKNLLEILANTSFQNRIKVSNPNILHKISLSTASEFDSWNEPEQFFRIYKTCAILGRSNYFFESKIEELLKLDLKIPVEGFLNIIEGSILTCRPLSYKLSEKAFKKIEKFELENESLQSLVRVYEGVTKLYFSYSFGKETLNRVTNLILQRQNKLTIQDIVIITELYQEYLPDDKELLYTAMGKILTDSNTSTLYNRNYLKRIVKSLYFIQIRFPNMNFDDNLAEGLIHHVCNSNKILKLLDIEAIFLIYKLTKSLNSLPSKVQSFMQEKLKNSSNNELIQLSIAIFLAKFNDPKMLELACKYTQNLHKQTSFSIETYIELYLFISRNSTLKEHQEINNFLNYIANETVYRIKDDKSIRDILGLLLKHYFEIKETKMAHLAIKKIISVRKELINSNINSMHQVLSDMVNFPCDSNEIKIEWVKFLEENKKNIDLKCLNFTINNCYKDYHLEPMIDILYYGNSNDSNIARCLMIRCPRPSHRLLSTTLKLLKDWNWLNNYEFNWPEPKLFNQIFLKGYGNEINFLFKTLNYASIIRDHPQKALELLKIQAQYGNIDKNIADLFISNKPSEFLSDSHCIAAIGTVYPEFLIENGKAFRGFFKIENDLNLFKVVEKVNLLMKLTNFKALKEPTNNILSYLTNLQSKPDLIIDFFVALDGSNQNITFFNQLTSHIITLILSAENPVSDNTIATLLLHLLIKNYQNTEDLSNLEQKFSFKLQDPDILEHLIRAYIKSKRLNNFLDQLLISSINSLHESTFVDLTTLKNA